MESSKVWLVTGASKGLGLSLTKKLLAGGYLMPGCARGATAMRIGIGRTVKVLIP